MGNPWFRHWPQEVAARENVIRPKPAAKPAPMKSVSQVLRESEYPAKFLQLLPLDSGDIAPLSFSTVVVKFDEDFPYRLDALQAWADGFAAAPAFVEVEIDLPAGRKLTRAPVGLSGFSGRQPGRDFVHFRYRFQPGDMVEVTFRNLHPSNALRVRGFLYGYKLTGVSRL